MLQPAVIFKICILPYEMLMHFIPFVFLMWTFKIYSIKKQFFLRRLFYFFLLFSKKKLQDKCLYLFWKAKSWKRQSCLLVTQSQANVDFLRFKHPIHMMMIRIFAFLSSVKPKKFPHFCNSNRYVMEKSRRSWQHCYLVQRFISVSIKCQQNEIYTNNLDLSSYLYQLPKYWYVAMRRPVLPSDTWFHHFDHAHVSPDLTLDP